MRQLVATGTGEVLLKDLPAPSLDGRPPGAIIRTSHIMIGAGSTLGSVIDRRKNPDKNRDDLKISYQISGIVKETTPGLAGIEPGDPVCCPGGGFAYNAEEVFVPVHLMGKLGSVDMLPQASAVNLAVTGLYACRRARATLGEWHAVIGLGMVGQFAVQFAKLFGAYVVGSDIVPQRIDLAREGGADATVNAADEDVIGRVRELTGGHGADAAMVAAKSRDESLFETVNKLVNEWTGRIVIIGMLPVTRPTGQDVELLLCGGCGPGWRDGHYKADGNDYPQAYVRWSTGRNIQLFADLLSEGRLNVDPLITHRFSADDADAAYTQLIENPSETLGVVLEMPQ